MAVKIVLTGDSHLNYYNQRMGGRLPERRAAIGQAWRQTVDYAIKNKVDLYLHVGDLFDQISPRNPPRAAVVEAFRQLNEAGVQSFILAGNHEAPGSLSEGASPHAVLREAGFATVFEKTTEVEQKIVDVRGTQVSIAGSSYNQRLAANADPLEEMGIPFGCDYNVAMLHYSIERIAPPIWEEPQIKLSSIERYPNINLWAMGHIHKHIDQRVGNSLILYPGCTERFDFGESDHTTGFCTVTLEDGKASFRYHKIDAQPMCQIKIHSSKIPRKSPMASLTKAVKDKSDPQGLLKLVLEGDMEFDEYAAIDFTTLFDVGSSSNFYFEYDDRIHPRIPGLEFKSSSGLHPRNELAAASQKAVESAAEPERATWRRASELALEAYDRNSER